MFQQSANIMHLDAEYNYNYKKMHNKSNACTKTDAFLYYISKLSYEQSIFYLI
jgi:hypothetical protein